MKTQVLTTALGGLLLASSTTAQTTSAFHAFGYGCQSCLKLNEDAQTNPAKTLRAQTLPNEYCYGFTAATGLTVHGFAMFTRAVTVPSTMGTAFYDENPAAPGYPSPTATVSSTMTADITDGWYVTQFATPVSVAQGAKFWVSGLDSTNIFASSILGGDPSPLTIYWRRVGTPWTPTGIVSNPGIVLICEGTAILGASNTPKIPSTNFSIDISNAPIISLCNMILGISNTTGPLGALPSDLGLIGFKGCTLWSSNEFTISGFTSTTGDYSWPIPIPNTPTLDGFQFYVQTYVISTMTSAIGFSNAGRCTVGTL